MRKFLRFVKDFGEPPLVTPSSQIVGTQAVLNVLQGERYKMITKESKKVLMGEFGQTIKPFNPEVQKKAIGDATPITCRPADLISHSLRSSRMIQLYSSTSSRMRMCFHTHYSQQLLLSSSSTEKHSRKKVDPAKADTENKAYPV